MASRTGINRITLIPIILVLAAAGISSYYFSAQSTMNQAGVSAESSPPACASASPVTDYVFTSPPPNKQVLLLQPGHTVEVCVTYQTNWNSSANFANFKTNYFSDGKLAIPFQVLNDVPVTTRIGTEFPTNSGTVNSTTSISSTPGTSVTAYSAKSYSGSFNAILQPNSIDPTLGLTSFTVLYIITPLSNSTGFYSDFGPAPGLLISVGYTASGIQASDFPNAGLVHPLGPLFPYHAAYVGVIGASVINLTIPRSA